MLGQLPLQPANPNVVVGFDTADDAAAYRLNDGQIVVQSVDFFTPVVDDPYAFGQIAAANALSDIYAMGAEPLFALNIVGFPRDALPLETLSEILRGGMDTAHAAGIHILGGHTIDDPEPKYGMVVTGTVAEGDLLRNSTARPGDDLVLTKPLGSGIIATAIKHEKAPAPIIAEAIRCMVTLNRSAAAAARKVGAHAVTDISGYGLLGHLLEMCQASGVAAEISWKELPLLNGTIELYDQGHIPGGTKRNLKHVLRLLDSAAGIGEREKIIAADAQTSGGLLIAVSPAKTKELIELLIEMETPAAAKIGRLTPGPTRLALLP